MEDKRISFRSAKLIKELGYDLEQDYSYQDFGMNNVPSWKLVNFCEGKYYPAPTQTTLQTYLRDKIGILLWINPTYYDGWIFRCDIAFPNGSYRTVGVDNGNWEDQLEEGLIAALSAIKFYKENKIWN